MLYFDLKGKIEDFLQNHSWLFSFSLWEKEKWEKVKFYTIKYAYICTHL